RRDGVHVVTPRPAGDDTFRGALLVGAADVLELPAAEGWVTELLTDAADHAATPSDGARASEPARTIGVVAGSGGAGATTLACAIALTAARTRRVSLVDLDPLGPGVDRVVGLDGAGGTRWDGLVTSPGRLGARSLRAALPAVGGLAVLTWGPGRPVGLEAGTVREVLSAARRGDEVVVVDLPRALDQVTAEVVTRCDRVVVVADPTVPGIASAGRVLAGLRALCVVLGLAVRDGPATVPAQHAAAALDLPLVAVVPRHRRLAEHVDLGLGPVHGARSALSRAAGACLAEPWPEGPPR
ncbi:MAG: septum site-determining protein Ssd, partial [Nocardioidaceae bacterium]